MEIINYDRVLAREDRTKRFLELVKRVQGESFEKDEVDENGAKRVPLKLCGLLVGPQLLWARARFDLKNIQVNKYNKLNLELFSKLDEPLELSKLHLRFSDPTLNFDF